MTQQSIRSDFHSFVAENVANDILYRRGNYYYFLGKVDSWGTYDVAPDDVIPQTQFDDNAIRGEMLYLKKITPSDVSLVVKRYRWIDGFVFDQWDHTQDMRDKPFYCVNSEFNIYKCLNNAQGAPSTVEPTGQSFFPIETADGYIWKFMYNIPSFKRTKFSSVAYMPVQRALSDSFYNDGAIDEVTVVEAGSGYSDVQLTLVSVVGTTTGSGATATISVGPLGDITDVNITSGGSGYTQGVKIDLGSASGYGASLTPVIDSGVITSVTIVDGGYNYLETDTITFRVGGAIVVPHVSRETGSITGTTIIDAGAGYVSAPTLTVYDAESVTTGTGLYGNPSAILTAIEYQGEIVDVVIEDPGVDYRADTNTQLIVQGDGEDAQFTPVVYDGSIINVIIENRGRNYTVAVINVVGTGTDASLSAGVSTSDFNSNQSIVEQTTVPGAIYSIVVTESGENYSSFTTTVTVSGNGANCTATPVIVDGRIETINITNYGQGYNYATVTIHDPNRPTNLGFTDASAYAIMAPTGGHGYNAPRELKARTVAINTTLVKAGNLNEIAQDFRQFGIIRNPNQLNSNRFFTGESDFMMYEFTLNNTTNLVVDETLVNRLNKFKVIAIESNDKVLLQQIGESLSAPSGAFTPEIPDGRSYSIISLNSVPAVNRFSGDLLYVSNENPFTFTEGQIVTVKTFIKL